MADLKLPRLNKAFIVGRITRDLELKYTPNGTAVINFSIAVDKRYRDEAGEWQSVTSFIDVVAWTYQAEYVAKNARKGSAVLVEGRIETRSYVDSNNINRKVFEIVAENIQALEWPDRGEAPNEEPPLPPEPTGSAKPSEEATNDDVPF